MSCLWLSKSLFSAWTTQQNPRHRATVLRSTCIFASFFPRHHRFGKDNMQRLAATSEALQLHIKLITLVKYWGEKSVKHLIICRAIDVLHCGTPWVLAPRVRLLHLLRQHLFHSAKISYANCRPAPLRLSAKSLLSPSCLASVAFLPARPHKYYPCTTNSIMRAVKRGKPTALSVFITLGRPGCKWKEIRGLLFLLVGRGRAGLAS